MITHKLHTLDAVELHNLESTDFTWHEFYDAVVKTYLTDRDAGLCEVTVENIKVKHLPKAGHALGGGAVNTRLIPGYHVRNIPVLHVSYFDAELEFMRKLQHGVINFVLPSDVTVI